MVDALSSRSSYDDAKNSPSASFDMVQPPARVLVNGYHGSLNGQSNSQVWVHYYFPVCRYRLKSDACLGTQFKQNGHKNSVPVSDPVTMFLLTDVALGESKGYEILSLEEVEDLKKEYAALTRNAEMLRRKLTLELKSRDATNTLREIHKPRQHLQNGNGLHVSTINEKAATNSRRCEELAERLWELERRSQAVHCRLLEHTAGILQMTHRGLKKNLKDGVHPTNDNGNVDGILDFDDRSLYRSPELLDGFGYGSPLGLDSIHGVETKIEELSGRMRAMILQASTEDAIGPPPPVVDGSVDPTSSIMSHLDYIENGLDMLNSPNLGNPRSLEPEKNSAVSSEKLHDINSRLYDALQAAGLAEQSPPAPSSSGDDHTEEEEVQLSYLDTGISSVGRRMRWLLDQKEILTTQIQQQRLLNSKSDSERDGRIAELTAELVSVRKEHESRTQDEASGLQGIIDQLRIDLAAKDAETSSTRQHADREIPRLEALVGQLRSETDAKVNEQSEARRHAENSSSHLRNELQEMEGEIVRVQTELTMCKAELDSVQGSKSQRAAEVSAEMQEQVDYLNSRNLELTEELATLKAGPPVNGELQNRVETLEKELRETIDDYEAITKASIEMEKEREKMDGIVDGLRDHCEQLERQLGEERINSLGSPNSGSPKRDAGFETTSTMVLKNEFKKMMRDTRAENMRILKVCSLSLSLSLSLSFFVKFWTG